MYHHVIITRMDEEMLWYVYISSRYYNKKESGNVAVCLYHYVIKARKDEEKLWYIIIIASLYQGRMGKRFGMYISLRRNNKEG